MSEPVMPILDTVKFTRVCEVLSKVEKEYHGDINELELCLEFLVRTFYPHVLKNPQDALSREDTLRIIEGRESLNED
jgi:hypothetical protein